jgi:hypothetical protein
MFFPYALLVLTVLLSYLRDLLSRMRTSMGRAN